jgi:hypothetical protein
MIVRRGFYGLGQEDAGSSLSLATVSDTLGGALLSPVNLGQFGAVPLWALGAVGIVAYMMLSSLATRTKAVAHRVGGRAKKIKRGFLD